LRNLRTRPYLPPDQSDSVYLLSGGLVRLCHLTMEGKQSIINLVEPGELFGEFGLFGLGPAEEYAEVVEAASVIQIPGEELRQLMRHYPEGSQRLMLLMAKRRRRLERRIKSLLFQSNRQRLVYLLLELAENYGGVAGDGIRLRIRLSHQDLANMIGSTRESVTVLLGELQNEGLIKVG